MTDFRVKIMELGGDMDVYTNATSLTVADGTVKVAYGEDEHESIRLDVIDEITINPNR